MTPANAALAAKLRGWPDCIVPGCPRKCCLRLHSPKCYPHTLGLDEPSAHAILQMAIEAELATNGSGHDR